MEQDKKYNEEFAYFINWIKLDEASFSNINVYYADLESLFMFKIRAIDDRINHAKLEPRQQDIIDCVSILRAYNIKSFDKIENEIIKNTVPYFPYAANYLIDQNIMKGNKFDITVANSYEHEDNDYARRIAQIMQEYVKQESHSSFDNSAK